MTRHEHLLTIAMEECAEVAQRLSKAMRFGLREVQPGQSATNAERIREEFNDLVAVLEMLEDEQAESLIRADQGATDGKKAKIETFLRYSRSVGTLVPEGAEDRQGGQ